MGILVGTIADGDGAQGLTMVLYLVLAALGEEAQLYGAVAGAMARLARSGELLAGAK